MSPDLLQILSQFGPAGLIGVLWIIERRHAAARDRHLHEAHRKVMSQDQTLEAVLNVIRDNTRAIAALEHTQRHMMDLVRTLTAPTHRSRTRPPNGARRDQN